MPTTYTIAPSAPVVLDTATTVVFTITRSGDLSAETLFASTTQNQGSVNNHDYTELVDAPIVFAAGQATQTITISITDNAAFEIQEANDIFGVVIQRNASDPVGTFLASTTFTIQEAFFNQFWDIRDVVMPTPPGTIFSNSPGLAALDVNADGHLDLVVTFGDYSTFAQLPLQVMLGDGAGHFSDGTSATFPSGAPLGSSFQSNIFVADLNGDGRPDLFVGDAGADDGTQPGGLPHLIYSSGPAGFVDASAQFPQNQAFSYGAIAADVDGDGDLDVFVANANSANYPNSYLALNNGAGVFTQAGFDHFPASILGVGATLPPATFGLAGAVFFDADGDGDPDLFLGASGGVPDQPSSTNYLLFNDGHGFFSLRSDSLIPSIHASDDGTISLAAADVDGDGDIDLFQSQSRFTTSNVLRLFLNDGTGHLTDASATNLSTGTAVLPGQPQHATFVDINNDGFVDILGVGFQQRDIYLNDGTGRFIALPHDLTPEDHTAIFTQMANMIATDVNGDGRTDFVGWNGQSGDARYHATVYLGKDQPLTQSGDGSANSLLGDGDSETLSGLGGDDVIFAAAGNDTLNGGDGNDYLNGGAGVDAASYADAGSAVTVSLALTAAQNTGGAGTDTLSGIENLLGSAFNDTLIGNSSANTLSGGAGNDTLVGGGGSDTVDGGFGNDWQDGQGGDDFLVGGAGGINNLVGGAGTDLISFTGSGADLFVDLSAGAYAYAGGGWDALTSIEGIAGGSGNDVLLGDTGDNLLLGGSGNDTLVGRAGSDTLMGEAGNDWIVGEDGDDLLEGGAGINVLIGGAGTDLASYASQTANLWIDMPAGVYSAAGVWDVFFDSIDGVLGGSGNDSIFGNASDNTLNGAAGDDALIGGLGNDVLMGGAGQDWIVGGDGDDRLIGGTNDVDVLTGGLGNDIFDLGTSAGWDVAFDFNTSQDSFYLGGLSWLGFLTIDADGDGQADDTLLGYAGGNFVALNVSGLTLGQWNALVTAGPLSGEDGADKAPADPDPQVRPVSPDTLFADGLDRSILAGFGEFDLGPDMTFRGISPRHASIYDVAPPDWTPLMA